MDSNSQSFTFVSSNPELFRSESENNFVSLNFSSASFSDRCFGFQFFLNTIVFGIMCVLGFFGNTISIVVLQRDIHNRVPIFLLQSLAIADNSVLLLSFVALSVCYGLLPFISHEVQSRAEPHIVRYLNPLGCAAESFAIWMTVLLALNRFTAVCRPFTSQKWLTISYARLQVAIVIMASILLNIPRVFQTDIGSKRNNSNRTFIESSTVPSSNASSDQHRRHYATTTTASDSSVHSAHWYFEVIYLNAFYTSLVLILPLFLLIGFNIPLMKQLQGSKKLMIGNSLSYRGRQENNITAVMVIIILQMIVCHASDRVVQIIKFFTESEQRRCPFPLFYAENVSNFLVMLSSSTNFVIYYMFRRSFRVILCDRLRCHRRSLLKSGHRRTPFR